jgi:hypothetical protein
MERVTAWWVALGAMSIINVAALAWVATAHTRSRGTTDPEVHAVRRKQLLFAALFVLGCGFRSIVPRADVQRICLIDSWVASVMVGRSVATIAELCLAAQWALLLRQVAAGTHASLVTAISRLILPLIAFAEVCSWFATLTTDYLGNAFEESTWALVSALIVTGLALSWSSHRGRLRHVLGVGIFLNLSYFVFMCMVDVPMYLSRWRADEAAGKVYLSLLAGVRDASHRWVATRSWQEWRDEIPWMSLYFSVGVWVSLALVRAPYLSRAAIAAQATVKRRLGAAAVVSRVSSR